MGISVVISRFRLKREYTDSVIVRLTVQQADHPDLIDSPKRVLAHRMARKIRNHEMPLDDA
jgi:hypothetical protein